MKERQRLRNGHSDDCCAGNGNQKHVSLGRGDDKSSLSANVARTASRIGARVDVRPSGERRA